MRKITVIAIMLVASLLSGLGVATVTVGAEGTDVQTVAANAQRGDRIYQVPCIIDLRAAHPEIPGETQEYLSWRSANPKEAQEWSDQLQACWDGHIAKYGKWNWDSMVLVRVEPYHK